MQTKIQEAIQSIRDRTDFVPRVGAVLGSGLGFLADHIQQDTVIPYSEIKHFPQTSVTGHQGNLILGTHDGLPVAFMAGRVHLYEGFTPQEVVFPIHVLKGLGVETIVVTNAAGGVNKDYGVGELMLINDHINMTGANPLVGPNDDTVGPRFPDMSVAYDPELREIAKEEAKKLGIKLHSGVYLSTLGPSYETPSEVRAFRILGADAVGMSTVPEVIAARHMGLRVVAISCISNPAAGVQEGELNHEEVTEAAHSVREPFGKLVQSILTRISSK